MIHSLYEKPKGEVKMKIFKKTIVTILALATVLSAALVPANAAKTVETNDKTVYKYTNAFYSGGKANVAYKIKYTGKNYIRANLYTSYENETEQRNLGWELTVCGIKKTGKTKPTVTIYHNDKNGNEVIDKKYSFTVKATKKLKLKDVAVNKGMSKRLGIGMETGWGSERYIYYGDLKYTYSKKGIAKVEEKGDYASVHESYTDWTSYVTGLKKGTTTVTVKLKGTKIGSFKVTVKNIKTTIKDKTVTLRYSKYGNVNLQGFYVAHALNNPHKGAKYTAKLSSDKILKKYTFKDTNYSDTYVIAQKKKNATVTVYEKIGSKKKTKIGKITVKIVTAKMNEVAGYAREQDNDGIFYENFIAPGQTYDLKGAVVRNYLDWGKNSIVHFTSKDYKFTFKAAAPEIVSVDKNGICTCHALDQNGDNYVSYKVSFTDGSTFEGGGSFDVWPEEELPI